MVKTRTKTNNKNMQKSFDKTIERFGRTLTHRAYTIMKDANGHLTGKTSADSTFSGVVIDDPRKLKDYIAVGALELCEAVLYVSNSESECSLVNDEDLIVEGSSAGTYDAWEVLGTLKNPMPQGQAIYYLFRLHRRDEVTLT